MRILYAVANEVERGGIMYIAGASASKKEALRRLAEQRQEVPSVYLEKFVITRCREGAAKKGW